MIPILLSLLLSQSPTYCDGYFAGFRAGFCYGRTVACLEQVPLPACPARDGTPRQGYDAGFDDGLAALGKSPTR